MQRANVRHQSVNLLLAERILERGHSALAIVRPLLEEHYNRIQALLDKNPTASRQELDPQIHAISNETHRKIHALLTDHQKQLEKAMQQRKHNAGENRRSAPPAAASSEPPSSAS